MGSHTGLAEKSEGLAGATARDRSLRQFLDFNLWEWVLSTSRVLLGRRRFLFWFTLAGIVVSVVIALVTPPWYNSTLTLMPPDANAGAAASLLAVGGLADASGASDALGALGMRDNGALFVNIIKSRTVQDRIVQRFHLKDVYGVKRDSDARSLLESHTAVSKDRESGVIIITVTEGDRYRAQGIAKAYFDELNQLVADRNTSAAHRERVFIEERLKVVKQDLDQAAQALSRFSSRYGTLDAGEQGKAAVGIAASLQVQLAQAETELRGMEQIYTPNNVRLNTLRARVAELRRVLGKIGLQGGTAEGQPPAGSSDPAYPSMRELPLKGMTYEDLLLRVKLQEGVYEALTKQYEMAKVQESRELPSVKPLDEPVVAEEKSGPVRRLIVYIGGLLAFVLGCGFVLADDFWAKLAPQDPRKQLVGEFHQLIAPEGPEGQLGPATWSQRVRRRIWPRR